MTGPTVEMPADTKSEPSTDGPLIVACLRISDLRPAVDPLNGAVTRDRLGVGLSPADAAGLEHALRIADAWSGRVVAVCVGPASVDPVLREVAALGVAVVRVPLGDEGDGHRYVAELAEDERGLARTLAAAIAPFGLPELVVCGDRSVDRGSGALPAYLAVELGAAQALGLVALEPVDGERMLVANATGCSSIYSGTFPTTPYCVSKEGRGPAWANSLFEDNAEYGYGMRLAVDANRKLLRHAVDSLLAAGTDKNLEAALKKCLDLWDNHGDDAQIAAEAVKKLIPGVLKSAPVEKQAIIK